MAVKATIYFPDHIMVHVGQLSEDLPLGRRVNDMLDRYGAALGAARREVMRILSDADRHMIQAACQTWATRGEPASVLIHGLVAEIEDAALPAGDLQGQDVAPLVAKIQAMRPIERLAVIEWLETGRVARE